ncbi:MAG: alpha/beta fold hydrolase [Pseudomonadota bacterium]
MPLHRLATAPEGPETLPPLVIAHGLFGSARNWGGLAKRFAAAGRRVVAVDMRNHGDSFRDPANRYADMAADLAEVLREEGGEADLLGHSMGGKAAMALALSDAGALRRLIVADIAPVAYAHTHQPYIDAMRAVDLSAVSRRSEADRALAAGVPDRALRAFLLQSLAVGPEGARWKLNLDALSANMADILDWPPIAGAWSGPALFLAGGASDYLTDAHHLGVRRLFPSAHFATVPGAGHWLHAEAPGPFAEAVGAFLG